MFMWGHVPRHAVTFHERKAIFDFTNIFGSGIAAYLPQSQCSGRETESRETPRLFLNSTQHHLLAGNGESQ